MKANLRQVFLILLAVASSNATPIPNVSTTSSLAERADLASNTKVMEQHFDIIFCDRRMTISRDGHKSNMCGGTCSPINAGVAINELTMWTPNTRCVSTDCKTDFMINGSDPLMHVPSRFLDKFRKGANGRCLFNTPSFTNTITIYPNPIVDCNPGEPDCGNGY